MLSDRVDREWEHNADQKNWSIPRNEGASLPRLTQPVSAVYTSLVYSESSMPSGLACDVTKDGRERKNQCQVSSGMEIRIGGGERKKVKCG